MPTYRWGINATGNIAGSMAEAIQHVPDAILAAVSSRSQRTAQQFADRWSVPTAYDSYGALLADPSVDVIYIATPNALHKRNIVDALSAGKHVLCEKPLTTSSADTRDCIDLARRQGKFFMEAMWTAFVPITGKAIELMYSGAIRTPRHFTANFIAYRDPQQWPNLYSVELGGGATLDIGIYPIVMAQLLAGPIDSLSSEIVYGETGVDEMVVVSARHESGVVSQLSFGFRADLPIATILYGDRGSITILNEFHHPDTLILQQGEKTTRVHLPYIGNGYAHEVMEVHRCIEQGMLESPIFPHELSLRSAKLLETLKRVRS